MRGMLYVDEFVSSTLDKFPKEITRVCVSPTGKKQCWGSNKYIEF